MIRAGEQLKAGDHQAELILRNKPIDLFQDRKYSKLLVSTAAMKPEHFAETKFFRLKLLPEQYCYAEYYYPENEPYRVYFHYVCNRWFVYKTYQRVDDLYAMDNFNAKAYYMGVIPNDVMKRGDFNEINDFISTVSVLHGEHQRKLELQHITGGAFRPNFRTMKGRKVAPTFLASHAREQKSGPTMIKILIDRHIADIRAYQKARIQAIEDLEQNDIIHQVEAFIAKHKAWVDARKKMCNYAALQHKVRQTVPFKRYSATRLVALKGITSSDLCNELIDYPVWVGFHYYFMRSLKKNGLKVVYDDINYAVQEGRKLRHLRVMPSKYAYQPQATTVFGAPKVYSKGQIPLDHWPISDNPPSIASVSGYSTVTKMSTATTSPNSWQNDWKMQSRHDEYDHRLTETTIPNVRDTRARGDEQFAVRFNKEINCRVDFAIADIETVMSTVLVNSKVDPRVAAASDDESLPTLLDRHGDMTWLKKAERRISQILKNDHPTAEDKKDLQVLYFAKQRYEQTLSRYEDLPFAELPDKTNVPGNETLSFGILNSGRAIETHMYINDSWRRIVDSNRFPPHVLHILKLLITDRDAWPLDSDFSNLTLADRADRISVPCALELFHRFHLKSGGMKFLAIGTMVFVAMLLMLLSFILIMTQNKEDLGYCPSSAIGFDPKNPYQSEWMRDSLKIKPPTNLENPNALTPHFFMLPE